MNTRRRVISLGRRATLSVAVAACLAAVFGSLPGWSAEKAEASSRYIEWKVFQAASGALLTVNSVFSALSGDEPSRRLLMTANCDPSQPLPYVVTVIDRLVARDAPAVGELQWRLPNGNVQFAPGAVLDRVAIANARGDPSARYGTQFHPGSFVWEQLLTAGRTGLTFKLAAGPSSPRIAAETERDRRAIGSFLDACKGFMRQAGMGASLDRRAVSACQERLDETGNYSQDIADTVCGNRPNDVNPANCMEYVMSGRVAWDRQGSNRWQPQNAANLCRESRNTGQTVGCFSRSIDQGLDWSAAIDRCRVQG